MRIKDGHLHVDHFGLIYLPYLNQWNAQNSNLLEMVTMMSSVFSTDPPVFKVPSQPGGAQPQRPVQPPQPQPQQQMQMQQPAYSQAPQYPNSNSNPYAQLNQQGQQQLNQVQRAPSYPPQPQQQPHSSPANYAQQKQPEKEQQDPRATKKNQLLQTLTTKLRQQLQDDFSLKTLLLDDLLQDRAQLEAHQTLIAERIQTMTQEAAKLEAANAEMAQRNEELNTWLQQNEKREMIEVDKIVFVKDTWSKQSVNARQQQSVCNVWRVSLFFSFFLFFTGSSTTLRSTTP
jgi:ESCRT-I complex subunit TSG101